MAADVEAVIAALRVALDEAENSDDTYWKVEAANRWVDELPGAWKGRWRKLKLRGGGSGDIFRELFVGHVRATLAFLEANRAEIPSSSRRWWPMRRRGNAQAAAKTEPPAAPARPVNLLRIRKPMPGLH
jgi:hypothetical protein